MTDVALTSRIIFRTGVQIDLQEKHSRTKTPIFAEDIYDVYEDVDGNIGPEGEVYSLKDLKEMWNANRDIDPVMKEYLSFPDWVCNTIGNF